MASVIARASQVIAMHTSRISLSLLQTETPQRQAEQRSCHGDDAGSCAIESAQQRSKEMKETTSAHVNSSQLPAILQISR